MTVIAITGVYPTASVLLKSGEQYDPTKVWSLSCSGRDEQLREGKEDKKRSVEPPEWSAQRPVPCARSVLELSKEMEAQERPRAPSRVAFDPGTVYGQMRPRRS
jgi:hypothetical protein